MKNTLVAILLALAPTIALADDLSPLALTSGCEQHVIKKVDARCNAQSRNDPNREHVCLYSQVYDVTNSPSSAVFSIDFTVTDAVVYSYKVTIQDKNSCQFTITDLQ